MVPRMSFPVSEVIARTSVKSVSVSEWKLEE